MILFHGSNVEIASIDLDTLVKGLEYRELTRQFLFHTTKAVSLLQGRGTV